MRFRFRLQRVLELREQAEQARARAVAAAHDDAERARQLAQAIGALRERQREALEDAARGVVTAGELQHRSYVVGELDDRLARAGDDVREAERVVHEAQVALQAAARDRRVLDRLKDRHIERHQATLVQHDRGTMDDIALSQFARRAAAPPDAPLTQPESA